MTIDGVTYNGASSSSDFFVIGGNADGTESGRVYLHYKSGQSDYLFDYASSNSKWCKWTKSDWSSSTILNLTPTSADVSSQISQFGFSTVSDAVAVGVAGNKLFNGVKIL